MQDQTIVRDPKLRRLVRDFDALADVLHTMIDRDRLTDTQSDVTVPHALEFTTEWQMVGVAEEAHPA